MTSLEPQSALREILTRTTSTRIVLKRWKAIYIVGVGLVLNFVLGPVVWLLPWESLTGGILVVLHSVWIYYATRIFRGRDEPIDPPRPWWKMTARHPAGFLLGLLFAFNLTRAIIDLVGRPTTVSFWLIALEMAAFALLYLGSSLRLWWTSLP